jgi:hypothetical protein
MVILYYYSDERYKIEPTLMAISGLVMWTKILNFLRLFDESGYLIRMIIEVILDMKIFMLILLITVFAFADAFYTISRANIKNTEIQNAEDHKIDEEKYSWF